MHNSKIKILYSVFFVAFLLTTHYSLLTTSIVFAEEGTLPQTLDDVTDRVEKIVIWLYTIFWVVDVGFIIWAAFTLIASGSSPEKLETAKKMLLYSLIAAAIVLLANGINIIVDKLLRGTST